MADEDHLARYPRGAPPPWERGTFTSQGDFPVRVELMASLLIGFVFIGAMMLNAGDDRTDYRKQIEAWHEHREAGLRSPTGWLTLVGRFWLKPGRNTIGSGETSDFLLPKSAPTQAGMFHVQG